MRVSNPEKQFLFRLLVGIVNTELKLQNELLLFHRVFVLLLKVFLSKNI